MLFKLASRQINLYNNGMVRFILALLLALLFSSNSYGSDKKYFPTETKSKYDSNNNGEISQMEFMHYHTQWFNKSDKNFDGKLTKAEIKAANLASHEEAMKKQFKKLDPNGDGNVTYEEFIEDSMQAGANQAQEMSDQSSEFFELIDVDRNNHISRAEFNDWMTSNIEKALKEETKFLGERFAHMDKNGDGIIREDEYLGKTPKRSVTPNKPKKKRIRRDGNGDGDITRSEDEAYNLSQFKKFDKNDDGVIKKSEARYLFMDE